MSTRLSKRAQQDLLRIEQYTSEQWGDQAALIYMQRLRVAMEDVAAFKHLGTVVKPAYRAMRKLVVEQHVMFYRPQGRDLLIVRVLHTRQDPVRNL